MTKWSWPLPNCIPWCVPMDGHADGFGVHTCDHVTTGITLFAPLNQPVRAVEDGTIVAVFNHHLGNYDAPLGSHAVLVEGQSGVVAYCGVSADRPLMKGVVVRRGVDIGLMHPAAKRVVIELYQPGYRGPLVKWLVSDPQPDCLMDPTPFLVQAWTRVTRRFHRSITPPLESKKTLVQNILKHPLWFHPKKAHVPNMDASWGATPNWTPRVLDMVGGFYECVDTEFVYVDPTLERILNFGDVRNQDFRVWVEAGGWHDASQDPNHPVPPKGWNDTNKWFNCHDMNLDCGAATAEDALVELAQRINWYYNPYDGKERKDVPVACGGAFDSQNQYKTLCVDHGDGFCTKCGYLMKYPWGD